MFAGTATATAVAAVAGKSGITGGSADSVVYSGIGPNVAGSCPVSGTGAATKTTYSVGALTISGVGYQNIMKVSTQTCTVQISAGCDGASGTDATTCQNNGGTWYSSDQYGFDAAVDSEIVCAYNRVQQWLTATGGTSGTTTGVSVGSASGMQASMGVLYQLLLNLTSAAYGKNYQDPVQRTQAGSYSEVCRSDASFKQETEDMKQAIDDLIEAHGGTNGTGGMRSAIAGHNFSSAFSNNIGVRGKTYVQCITGTQAGTGASAGVTSVENELSTYKNGIKNRITEISNRIGYLNGKNTAVGGAAGGFVSSAIDYLLLDGTDGSGTDAGDNILMEDALSNDLVQMESAISGSISVGSAGDGFNGYDFSGGKGYANTIFSHANFLAGKKIKLFGKILAAIADVDTIYEQIQSKRSEYYEYNQ